MPIPVTPQNENRLEKEGLDSIAAISDAMSSNGEHAFKAGNGPAFGEIRDRDYIIVQGRTYTIDGLRGTSTKSGERHLTCRMSSSR